LFGCSDALNDVPAPPTGELYAYDADADSPYIGGWPAGLCADDVGDGEGYERGEVIPDFGLVDQFGDTVYIRDFCNRTIFIHGAAFW
jgi:hypothetical protein